MSIVLVARGHARRRLVLATAVVLLAVAARVPARAQPPAATPGQWDAYASEELVARLVPYLLGPTEAPPGYTLDGVDAETPVGLAVSQRPAGTDPQTVFAQVRSLWLVQVHEYLMPAGKEPASPLNFTVSLVPDGSPFASPAARPPDATALDLPEALGEARDAWQQPVSEAPQLPLQRLVIRWQRGALVFELQQLTATVEQDFAALRGYAAQIDAHEAQAPPYDTSPPTITPVATEPERLQALLSLEAIAGAAAAPPAGYHGSEPMVTTAAQFALHAVLNSTDPAAALADAMRTYPLVAGLFVPYIPDTPSQPLVAAGLALYGNTAAAQADLFLVQPEAIHEWIAVNPVAPPLMLGDTTTAVEARAAGEEPAGGDLVLASLNWTHGPLRLGVAMEGQVDWPLLAAFAEQLEMSYQTTQTP